jgi:hypothetical protein
MCAAITRDSFESAQPSWRLAEKDGQAKVIDHHRSFEHPHSGQTCETLRLEFGQATKVYLSHEVTPSRVISELSPQVWVRADRPGVQFLTRVVLPQTPSPTRQGSSLTTLLHGNFYTDVGSWQKLAIPNVERALLKQLPILRRKFGSNVSLRGAYVDLIILNAYTGPGTVNISIDDLEVNGHVTTGNTVSGASNLPPSQARQDSNNALRTFSPNRVPSIRMKGSVLEVSGRPMFVRGIEHNGEPFSWLKSIGFNVVVLPAPPTAQQLAEAKQLEIWFVAPPPQVLGRSRIDDGYERVLVWSLGEGLTHAELETSRELAAEVRQTDAQRSRPIMCAPDANLWDYSRFAEVIRLDLLHAGTSFDSRDYITWLRTRSRLVRGRTCLWASIQTEPHTRLVEQVVAISPATATVLSIEPEQVRHQVYQALASGVRGLIFRSRNRLDASGTTSRLRTATLQMTNLELMAVEPWVAGGSYSGEIETGLEDVSVSVLETSSSRLLLVQRNEAQQQYVSRIPEPISLTMLDTGATASAIAYEVSPTSGLKTVTHWRKPGGIRIKLDKFRDARAIVLSPDPLVRKYLATTSGKQAKTAAELQHEMAARWLELFDRTMSELGQVGAQAMIDPKLSRAIAVARQQLNYSERVRRSGDLDSAFEFARSSRFELSQARHMLWKQAVGGFASPAVSPFCRSFETLPLHWQLASRIRGARWSSNLLAGGDCENLAFMRQRGWQYNRFADSNLFTAVSLVPQAANGGQQGLKIQVWSDDPKDEPAVVESPPAWITTAPVRVRQGQITRIHGWVRIPRPITGSLDGLIIFDSSGGIELGERITKAEQWREFTLYRVATRAGDLTVTFALTGVGEVWLDGITIHVVDPQGAQIPRTGQRHSIGR